MTKEEIKQALGKMTVLELAELVKELEDEWGVSAAAPVAVAAAPGTAVGEAAVDEEKTEFNVILTSFGDKKIQVIKEIRAITDLGLMEAKELVQSVPSTIKEGVEKEEAAKLKEQLEGAGAVVEIK
jgi:large subunit ribosomal protein L7/L12